jgi:hypothetical protein
MPCPNCSKPLPPADRPRAGKPQKFCSPSCRATYHDRARRIGLVVLDLTAAGVNENVWPARFLDLVRAQVPPGSFDSGS